MSVKLTSFSCAPEPDYQDLKRQIDRLPVDKALRLENCELPLECTPNRATVVFYKYSNQYVMCLDKAVRYSGQNWAMVVLCKGTRLPFADFNKMKIFLLALPAETAPAPGSRGNGLTDGYDLNSIVNMDDLTLPTEATSTPDFKSILRELEKSIMGQETAVKTFAHQTALHLKKNNPQKPLSFVCYGLPGTGKSETAKCISKTLSKLGPHKYSEVWTDLNQYTEAHSVYRLIGSPPGYIGYNDSPVFEAVTRNPYTVFIWDELDKAHPEVLKTFMAILDEGRCAARKDGANHTREYNFKHCIFIFTSNYRLGASPKKRIGFSFSDDVEDIRHTNDAVEVDYREERPEDEYAELTKKIYRNTEAARKSFVEAGVLREIASRFSCFVEFKELSAEAKIRILAKQVVETGFEYNVRLAYISPDIMQALINASASENVLTVRSFKAVIEGYLASAFAEAGVTFGGQAVRLEGTIESPVVLPE